MVQTEWQTVKDNDQTEWQTVKDPGQTALEQPGFAQTCLSEYSGSLQYEPHHEKTCLRGLRQSKTQTGLLNYRDKLES